jgi:SAM-dependent methyltransferase
MMRTSLESAVDTVVNRLLSNLPARHADRLRLRLRRLSRPARLGTLRRTSPISDDFGYDRGTPIDRYYIEQFLAGRREHIRGRVLEVKDETYTNRFGIGVTQRDVIDIVPNPNATIIANLAAADDVPDGTFDCFILTQTLQYVYDTNAAVAHSHRILKPHGTLLVTVPAVSSIGNNGELTDYWHFTSASCSEIFGRVFGRAAVSVRAYGNVLTGIAFLAGLACEELTRDELETHDDRFPLVVSVCAVK